jgi:hypothetical protein
MSIVTASYRRVPYELRPAKQIERRMLLDTFQKLVHGGFPVRDYQYTGFGSVSFVDFVLLHKYLGIQRMLSVEHSTTIRKRILFNRPFENLIQLAFTPVSSVIPTLSSDRKHILWLDYDDVINKDMLSDVQAAVTLLSPGSILLVTVDVEPPGNSLQAKDWMQHYEQEVGDFLGKTPRSSSSFVREKLPRVNIDVLRNAIQNALLGRPEVEFLPVFNFVYSDGHRMLTLGGILGTATEKQKLNGCDFDNDPFIRFDLAKEPFHIRVPILTRKERLHLDSSMPCRKNWKPKVFELDREDIEAYRISYRYFPSYFEALL